MRISGSFQLGRIALARSICGAHVRVLLIEDNDEIARREMRGLAEAGFSVQRAADGNDGLMLARQPALDAIVLDLGLPGKSGLEILRELRAEGITTSIIVVSARGAWIDKVAGLNEGADDYLAQPVQMQELVARLHALMRRGTRRANNLLRHEEIAINMSTGEVRRGDMVLDLTPLELRMLRYFLLRPGRVVSHLDLTEHLYEAGSMRDSNTIEVYIGRLRRKIGREKIRTLRGLGYRFG